MPRFVWQVVTQVLTLLKVSQVAAGDSYLFVDSFVKICRKYMRIPSGHQLILSRVKAEFAMKMNTFVHIYGKFKNKTRCLC